MPLVLASCCSSLCRLFLDDVHPAKSKSFYNKGADAPSAVQNRIEFGAINIIGLRESEIALQALRGVEDFLTKFAQG